MKILQLACSLALGAVLSATAVLAQISPAEQLLPDDTIGLITIPDFTKFTASASQSAWGQLWADPAMKPFRDNFMSNFQSDFLQPLEKQLGVKLTEYQDLLQGQVTIALTPPKEGSGELLDLLLLVDTKDKSEQLSTRLAELKKKWTDAGKTILTEKIRDVEFSTVSFSGKDVQTLLKKAFPGDEDADEEQPAKKEEQTQLRIGQYKSLLIVGENTKSIEKLLARQTGGLVPPLAEKAVYQRAHTQLFRDSLAHAWFDVKPIFEKLLQMAREEKRDPTPGMPSLQTDKILPVLGFGSIDSLAANMNSGADGSSFDFLIGAPEAQREGLVKILALEKKEAAPPGFVPADVSKFQRTRIDAQKAWTTLESMLGRIDPSVAGLVQLMLSTAGKDKDPNFDLKKNLIGNLGDDFIQYEKVPQGAKPADLQQLRSLTLIGSPNPAQLLDALRMITSLLPPPISSAPLKEREFLGKKIYSLSLGTMPESPDDPGPGSTPGKDGDRPAGARAQSFSFASSSGYVAFSTDDTTLEEFLRSSENPPKPLRATPGFTEAAAKVGGMETGFFSYENQRETTRFTFDLLKSDPDSVNSRLYSLAAAAANDEEAANRLIDLKLLPPFDRIAKYFGIAVASASTTPDGFLIKAATPKPPALK